MRHIYENQFCIAGEEEREKVRRELEGDVGGISVPGGCGTQ